MKNTGNTPITLSLATNGWSPLIAEGHVSVGWDWKGASLGAAKVGEKEKAHSYKGYEVRSRLTQKTLKVKKPTMAKCSSMKKSIIIGGVSGAIAPVFTYACILLAIESYREFNWYNNALSDLGVIPGLTMNIFNGGLIVGGILFTIFAIGLTQFLNKNLLGRIGAWVLVIACISLICVGIFNEDIRPIHYIVSVSLFFFMPIALWILTGSFWVKNQKKLSIFTMAIGVAAAIPWILEFTIHYAPNVAIPEFISGFATSIWVIVLSIKMLRET